MKLNIKYLLLFSIIIGCAIAIFLATNHLAILLSILATLIIFIPFLWWLIEITKAFESLKEREKSIKVRRIALGQIDKN